MGQEDFETGNERNDVWDGEVAEVEVFLRINLLRSLGFPFPFMVWSGLGCWEGRRGFRKLLIWDGFADGDDNVSIGRSRADGNLNLSRETAKYYRTCLSSARGAGCMKLLLLSGSGKRLRLTACS